MKRLVSNPWANYYGEGSLEHLFVDLLTKVPMGPSSDSNRLGVGGAWPFPWSCSNNKIQVEKRSKDIKDGWAKSYDKPNKTPKGGLRTKVSLSCLYGPLVG